MFPIDSLLFLRHHRSVIEVIEHCGRESACLRTGLLSSHAFFLVSSFFNHNTEGYSFGLGHLAPKVARNLYMNPFTPNQSNQIGNFIGFSGISSEWTHSNRATIGNSFSNTITHFALAKNQKSRHFPCWRMFQENRPPVASQHKFRHVSDCFVFESVIKPVR